MREEVQAALLAVPEEHVTLSVFEWSAQHWQRQVLDWTPLPDAARIAEVAGHLSATSRQPGPGATGLGRAMDTGAQMLNARPDCRRRVLDISGDGWNNDWPEPRWIRSQGALGDVQVNALVIVPPDLPADGQSSLPGYFRAEVIHGPGAFVEIALGFDDYARAMARKLLRELEGPVLGRVIQASPAG